LVLNPALDDKWIWSLEASGEFTVKSLSHVIQKKLLTSDVSDMAQSFKTLAVLFVKFTWNLRIIVSSHVQKSRFFG
ncbi:hypothetical protein Tco_0334260, partial [Tanacetum coccineum]